MRKIIIVNDVQEVNNVLSLREVENGEPVQIVKGCRTLARGEVSNVRKYPRWEGKYLYDVRVFLPIE